MEDSKKKLLTSCGFGKQVENAEKGICVFCEAKVSLFDFKDALSLKEFKQSGICQECQDKIFE